MAGDLKLKEPLRRHPSGVYARNCIYEQVTGWESFEPTLTKAEQADMIDIWRCAEAIVPEWYRHDSEGLERSTSRSKSPRSACQLLRAANRPATRNERNTSPCRPSSPPP